jgi:hypothetical protein
MTKPVAMLYTAGLEGHRQLYCDVLADIFLELGYAVLIVGGVTDQRVQKWQHIERYRHHPDVTIHDTGTSSFYGNKHLKVYEIIQLQTQYSVEASVFICGDELRSEFLAIGKAVAPRLAGWNTAIFGLTERWSAMRPIGEPGLSVRQRIARLRDRVGPINPYKRFFEDILKKKHVLDMVLVKDERVAEQHGFPFVWFPDIYRPFNWQENDETAAEYNRIIPLYQHFLKQQASREVLLYFGTAAIYKGYNTLLRLALADGSTCFVHCGSMGDDYATDSEVLRAKAALSEQRRIFETPGRVESQRAVRFFFESTRRFVSTHTIFLSSGTMLQALDAGKPVLMPDCGLLRYRTIQYGLGRVYNPARFHDLLTQWGEFRNDSPAQYSNNISKYMENYSRANLLHTISGVLAAR